MSRRVPFILLILLISVVYFGTAGRAIFDDGDALYSHIALQMARSGDWVTPYANGVRFLDKPPIMYWLMASAYHVFGFNEFAARLPAALAVLGISLLLFFLGKREGGPAAGFIAGAVSALCIGTFLFTRMAFPDVLFVFFLTLSVYAFLKWFVNERNPLSPALWFYASMAGALLTKGLMGLVFPAAIVILFLLWSRAWSRLRHFHLVKGTLLFLVLALPWHILAAVRNPGFLWYYFVNEQFLRFLGKRLPVDYASISLPVFWGLCLVWLFPWSVFLPAIRHGLRDSFRQPVHEHCAVRLCMCWAVVVFVFFSCSSRIEHYSMPIFPPLALMLGVMLSPESPFAETSKRSIARGFAFLGILGGIIALLLLGAGGVWMWMGGAGSLMDHSGTVRLHAYKTYFAPLFELPPDVLRRLMVPLVGTCSLLAAGFLGAWWMNRRGRRMPAIIVLSLVMSGFCYFTYLSLGICEEILSSRQFGQKLNQLYRPGDRAVVLGDYETANSINFYSPLILNIYGGSAALLDWGMRYPDAPRLMLSQAELMEKWKSPQRMFLLSPEDQLGTLNLQTTYFIMRSGGRILLCNRKVF